MRKFLRLLLFIMAFQMEVRVRASGDVISQPPGCQAVKSSDPCVLQVTSREFHYIKNNVRLHAKEGAALSRVEADHWKLLQGILWVEAGKNLELETVYASMRAPTGAYWVLDLGDRVLVRNVNADLVITLRDGKKLSLPEGFEIWISGINSLGVSEYGVLRPVDLKEHMLLWGGMYQGSKEQFIAEARSLKSLWGDLTEKSSSLYKSLVQRELASIANQAEKEKQRKERVAAEKRRVRELFYQRTFER